MSSTPPVADLDQIGRYRVLRRLAVGGMAEIFLAVEGDGAHALGRTMVIKRILPHLLEKDDFIEMFFREARIAARINHQNVVQIYELGESDGFPYIAMEYVQGRTLSEVMRTSWAAQAPVPVPVGLQIITQACAGAHAAHRLRDQDGKLYSLVHRDISPNNLMINADGLVKLLDFGIVKARGSEKTKTGVMKGKLAYMSPEQLRQEPLDSRTDVFALGLVAFEMLAQARMFTAPHEVGLINAILKDTRQDLRTYRPEIPAEVVDAIDKATAHRPADRFESAKEFRHALKAAAGSAGIVLDQDDVGEWAEAILGTVSDDGKTGLQTSTSVVTHSEIRRTTFGRYEIRRLLAPARFGVVFVAFERPVTERSRKVALTLVDSDRISGEIRRDLLQCWAHGAALSHPTLVEPLDYGERAGILFAATPWLDGWDMVSVWSRLNELERRMSTRQLASMGLHLADALATIYGMKNAVGEPLNLVHGRMAMPGLFLMRSGHIRLLGFPATAEVIRRFATRPSSALGYAFLAPEQVRGDEAVPATDAYALAIVLLSLASGGNPFLRETTEDTGLAILTGALDLDALEPDLAEILGPALASDPADRPDMASLSASLLALLRDHDGQCQPSEWSAFAHDLFEGVKGVAKSARAEQASEIGASLLHAVESRSSVDETSPLTSQNEIPTREFLHPPADLPEPARRQSNLSRYVLAAMMALVLVVFLGLGALFNSPAGSRAAKASVYIEQAEQLEQNHEFQSALDMLELAEGLEVLDASTNIKLVQTRARIQRQMHLLGARRDIDIGAFDGALGRVRLLLDANPSDAEALALANEIKQKRAN